MAFRSEGPIDFTANWDAEGQRTYTVTFLLTTLTPEFDGPQQAMICPDLPVIGSTYAYGNEIDIWAWRQPGVSIKAPGEYRQGNLRGVLHATVNYTTRPRTFAQDRPNASGGAPSDTIENPLSEPARISIGFNKFTEEATKDRFGRDVTNSAFESLHGATNEWDSGRPTVSIEQNIANINLPQLAGMLDTVNSTRMWGHIERAVKLSSISAQKKFGKNNSYYWTRTLNFEINLILDTITRTVDATTLIGSPTITLTSGRPHSGDVGRKISGPGIAPGSFILSVDISARTITLDNNATMTIFGTMTIEPGDGHYISGWDRDVIDEGTKALRGKWSAANDLPRRWILDPNADAANPMDYVRATDPHGNITKVILDGAGVPFDTNTSGGIGNIHLERYTQSNFFILGIPSQL